MKNFARFLTGLAVASIGLVLILLNINVTSFGFYRIGGRVDTAVILLVILAILIVWCVLSDKIIPNILVAIDLILMIISVIFGTRFVFKPMSAFSLVLIISMIAVGVGLIISSFISQKGEK